MARYNQIKLYDIFNNKRRPVRHCKRQMPENETISSKDAMNPAFNKLMIKMIMRSINGKALQFMIACTFLERLCAGNLQKSVWIPG